MKTLIKFWGKIIILLSLTVFIFSSAAYSQVMEDYCITPPFIVAGVKPNLLMTIDNSASMFDLIYIDKGRYTGTCSGGGVCSNTVSCPEGEICTSITYTRDPSYCYDQTYNYGNYYKGYFEDWYHYYEYDFVNNYFKEVTPFPASCDKYVTGTLCINLDTTVSPPTVKRFVAEGNYLNWLTASKFDIQKWILTGGKYIDKACSSSTDTSTISCNVDSDCPTGDTCNDIADNYLKSESRGCVGRKFIKEAITTQSFQEYSDPNPNPNTSLGITFGVRGPEHPFNDTLLSIGGQTFIDIFQGDYKEALCQEAVDAFIEGHDPASIKKAVEDCLSALSVASYCQKEVTRTCTKDSDCIKLAGVCTGGPKTCTVGDPTKIGSSCKKNADCDWDVGPCVNPTATTEAKQKVVFTQSIQACWALDNGTPISIDEANTVKNQCTDLYDENYRCVGGDNDGMICTGAADCPGGTCEAGPHVILPGNPSLLCGLDYAGACYAGGGLWTGCLPTGECGDDCIIKKHEEFCGDVEVPPVIDPSDDPSTTENYDNLPAIIGDIGIESQLGAPIATLTVKLNLASPPSGVIQEFEDIIHFGAMTFNYYGSSTECPANVPCTKICNTSLTVCETNLDCPTGETCVAATNLDGGMVIGYIMGNCSTTTATTCSVDSHCPAGETCEYSVGDHNSGLISAIDDIFASTWTPFAEGFYEAIGYFAQRTSDAQFTRLNNTDYITEGENPVYRNPVQYRCQKNNVLLITDGMSTADLNANVNTLVSTYNDGDGQIDAVASATCPKFAGSRNIDDLAWLAKNKDITDFTSTPPVTDVNSKTITSYVVFNGVGSTDPGECNPDRLLLETGENGCDPGDDCYHKADDPEALKNALRETLLEIAGQAASGTAASVLATGEGSGANLVQAIFYPEITFPASNEVTWVGTLKNIWYYIDPFLGNSSIREDTSQDNTLSLTVDDIVTFYFDTGTNTTMAHLYRDTDGDGDTDSEDASRNSPVYFENVRHLWEAGAKLWVRSADDRIIYTTTTGSSRTDFTTANAATLRTLLHADSDEEAINIIQYVRGYDNKYCSVSGITCSLDTDCTEVGERCSSPRNRITKLDLNGDGDTTDTVNGISEGVSRVYKLGDIVNSTPRIVSFVPLNNYYKTYQDNTYKEFTETTDYQNRGIVLVGANDGMLHAFKLGKIEMFEEKSKKATISGTDIGKEEWAFIPRSALPYLEYLRDGTYCHLYYTDLTPYVLDASICAEGECSGDYWDQIKDVNSWRTIVIGGLRLGGACKDPTDTNAPAGVADTCTKDINGDGAITNEDCVLTPTSGIGYSSYFALDITNPTDPQVLWEFTDPNLGYSTTGPAIVRIAGKTDASKSEPLENQIPDHNKNGRWFVVIGSGPTGPINTNTRQFYGHSDQNMRVFVLDLKDGSLVRTIDSGIQNAFAGSMVNAQADFDMDNLTANGFYQDDAVYFGFTKAENNPPLSTTKWNSGGVMRLFTKNSLDPDDWALNKVIENIGPVTSAVTRLQNFKEDDIWLFWGTGRYYFKIADNIDDSDSGRSLYGVKEPCFSPAGVDFDCTTTVARSSLGDASSGASSDEDGWYINLDLCTDLDASGNPINVDCSATSTSGYKTERNVTDPLATPIGAVFFTTTKPAADVCSFGGASHLWVVDYDTGGAVSSSILRGKALLQVSTGSIEEITLESALTEKGGRRTPMIQGVPPTGAPPGILIPPNPVDKILHIREK
ncbi:MAG: hypothetical protein HXY53_00675 [Nitrospirae bacterium]|nr:hypothetical protein [Nitrospirota bacterium]